MLGFQREMDKKTKTGNDELLTKLNLTVHIYQNASHCYENLKHSDMLSFN